MSTDGTVEITIHVDTSGIKRALSRPQLSGSAVRFGTSLHAAAREFEEAMERIRVLTEGAGAETAEIARQIHQLSLASGRSMREATDAVLTNGPWHWEWSAPTDEWPWASAARRSQMHAAYRAKTRRRNRR